MEDLTYLVSYNPLADLLDAYLDGEHDREPVARRKPLKPIARNPEPQPAGCPAKPPALSEGKRFLAAFGEKGGVWFAEGKSFDEAQKLYVESLKAENKSQAATAAALRAEAAELQSKADKARGAKARLAGFKNALGHDSLAKLAAGMTFDRQRGRMK